MSVEFRRTWESEPGRTWSPAWCTLPGTGLLVNRNLLSHCVTEQIALNMRHYSEWCPS